MTVRITNNFGNEFYNQFIGMEFEATKTNKGIYIINDIKTKTKIKIRKEQPKYIPTTWFRREVEEI